MKIKINCGFSRQTRKPHRKTKIEFKNVQGIVLDLGQGNTWDNFDHQIIRSMLKKHAPFGVGWGVSGYACVEAFE